MYDLCLLIPAFQEEKRIKKTLDTLFAYFEKEAYWKTKKVCIAVIDDGSTDETGSIVQSVFATHKNSSIDSVFLQNAINLGKGAALQKGVQEVEAKHFIFTDADLSFSPDSFTAFDQLLGEHDLVIGERKKQDEQSWYSRLRMFISRSLHTFVQFITGIKVADTQCGLKGFRSSVAKEIFPKIQHARFSFDVELILRTQNQGFSLKSIPVSFQHDKSSSVGLRDGLRFLLDVVSIGESLESRLTKRYVICLVSVAVFLTACIFGWTLHLGYFFSDDFTWLWYGKKIVDGGESLWTLKMSTFFSPVLNAFDAFGYKFIGLWPPFYFFFGLVVHALVSIFSGILTFKLSRSKAAGFLATFLVAVAGGAYEPLVWVGANMHSIVTLFILLSILFYTSFLEKQKTFFLIFSFLAFLLALGAKELGIVTPALLLFTFLFLKKKFSNYKNAAHYIFAFATFSTTLLYGLFQYISQKESIWITSNIWTLSPDALIRIPFIFLDQFIPIAKYIDSENVFFFGGISLIWLIYLLVRYRKLSLLWYGFFWILIGIAPTIFFSVQYPWEPLPSRYNYLPRIGAVIMLSILFSYIITHNTAKYVVQKFAVVLLCMVSLQIFFMAHTISREYLQVYHTGRELVRAAQEIKKLQPASVAVLPERPFPNNYAHIVGALDVISSVPESNIQFLSEQKNPSQFPFNAHQVVLSWNMTKRVYEVFSPSIQETRP